MNPLILLCPGQGAQAVAMGKSWAHASAPARAAFQEADQVLGASLGAPLSTLCFEGPADRLNQTDASQPALFVAGVASLRGLAERWGMAINDLPLACAAGLSLGEYTALHLAGSIDFAAALRLVAIRGRAMQDAATAVPSGMVALIGADEAQAQALCDRIRERKPSSVAVCANLNAPGQVVISGDQAAMSLAVELAGEASLRATPLPVAGAFHSPLMRPAADRLGEALAKTTILQPRCPVVSNVTALPHQPIGAATWADEIRRRLVDQLTAPVRWEASCRWIIGTIQAEWHEVAPGKTLAGLMRRIDRAIKVNTHDDPSEA